MALDLSDLINVDLLSRFKSKLDNILNEKADKNSVVPTTRKVNNKALSADITLTASDVGAATPSAIADGTYDTIKAGTHIVAGSKASLYTSSEGGNLQIVSPSGYVTEFDSWNDTQLRFVSRNAENTAWCTVMWNRTDNINLSSLKTSVSKLTYDSGEKRPSFASGFADYSTDSYLAYRRIGNMVHVYGAFKPTAALAANDTLHTVFTLPAGYRPYTIIRTLCHGSGKNTWLCVVNSSGVVSMSRYGISAYAAAGTDSWLPIDVLFLTTNAMPT